MDKHAEMGWCVRPCRPEEAEALLELWKQAQATPSVTDTPADLRRVLAAGTAYVFVAEAGGQVAGSIIGTFDGWRGHIYRLAVHPDFRRRGIARVLVRAVEERLIAAGARRIIPLVEKDHAWATAFWQSVGYAPDPRIVRYLRNV
jgi:ribosomal protein S18 acetylase RimI-like enzyme